MWIETYLPESLRPYAYLIRIDRPIGIWLLLLPGLWGILLAGDGLIHMTARDYYYIILFSIGAVIMRGAGCVINDLWDRDLDKMVERTKNRPLANGTLSPMNAIAFLIILLFMGLTILLQFNATTRILGCMTLPLIAIYPLMKRITWWPQVFLGLTFNFGALMGWSAVAGEVEIPALLLYGGGIFWTLGYDTIYAHQDKEDDALARIKSTALKFGRHSKIWVSIFYTASILLIFTATVIENTISSELLVFMLPALHLTWQIRRWEITEPESALSVFKSNLIYGLLILFFLAL